jgi:twinkle protein
MTYEDYNILIPHNKTTGEIQTICPSCSHERKKKTDKCLSVNLDKKVWNCFHCGYKGALNKILKTEYKVPEWKNKTSLSTEVVKYFETRKICQDTLIKAKVTDGIEWMPKNKTEINTIQFNYFRDGILTNIKYRGKNKDFKLFKDAELILYNLDSINPSLDHLFIVEGEIDCLTFLECGIENVVSVPNGANLNNNKMDYISNCWDKISHIKNFVIAVDNDAAGLQLRKDLSHRLGLHKCKFLEFDGFKDANDFYKANDINVFKKYVAENIKEFPMEGIFGIEDIYKDLESLYFKGLPKGTSIGLYGFELSFVKGYITTITGIPGHGKSDFLDFICLKLLKFGGWKGVFYSPENKPTELHVSKLVRKIIGKSWDGHDRMTPQQVADACGILNENIWFVKPEKDFTIDTMLDRIKQLKDRHGLDYFVIDAWNKLEHRRSGQSETDYVGETLDKIGVFCEAENIHAFIVVHPTKMRRQKDSMKYEIPTLYDCSGSANFFNKSDNGLCVYRDFETGITSVVINKVKFSHWGSVGSVNLNYDLKSGRYFQTINELDDIWI